MSVSFQTWVDAMGGPTILAQKLGVTEMIVHHWYRRLHAPKVETMRRIIRLSDGKFDFNRIINDTTGGVRAAKKGGSRGRTRRS